MIRPAPFRQHLLEQGVLEPEGTHHEFAYGRHGQKLDFDLIPRESPLYQEWVDVTAATIEQRYARLPHAVLGIANGTNRLAEDVAPRLGITALYTHKTSSREVTLSDESCDWLANAPGVDIVALEDVGTTGGTAYTGVRSVQEAGAGRVEGLFTWQRCEELEAFIAAGVPYHAVIHESLPTYTPEQCLAEGYCAQGWELIPHAK